uniref:TruB_N domain-containing protein n=1 Tax=Trichuris muris TaxID=70415 RepID=A0A5S6R5H8_TRIMR
MLIRTASEAWRLLNGVCSLYKPSETTIEGMTKLLVNTLSKELNEMDNVPLKLYRRPVFREDPKTAELKIVDYVPQIDYTDHPLVIGKRYLPIDFNVQCIQRLGYFTSGICMFGINDGCDLMVPKIKKSRFVHAYRVTGLFGRATLDQTVRSKIVEKATYGHVTKARMDAVLAKLEAENAKAAFSFAGVDMQSQRAFELATRGLVRPREDSSAIFYRLKCLQLRGPFFTLEVQCINESDDCLKTLIHELGLSMKTVASCVSIKKVRDGPFDLDLCLLDKHWNLENIINNIGACQQAMESVDCDRTLNGNKRPLAIGVDTIASDDDPSAEETEFVNPPENRSYDQVEFEEDYSSSQSTQLSIRNTASIRKVSSLGNCQAEPNV